MQIYFRGKRSKKYVIFKKSEVSNFFNKLENFYPDFRKKQGLKHNLSFVLTGVLCSLLSGKQRISSIQRYLKNKHKFLCQATRFKAEKVISDVQLRRVLSRLDWSLFNDFMEDYFGISVSELADNEWIAVDGKELRGSIETASNGKKDKRGTTLLDAVGHEKKW